MGDVDYCALMPSPSWLFVTEFLTYMWYILTVTQTAALGGRASRVVSHAEFSLIIVLKYSSFTPLV